MENILLHIETHYVIKLPWNGNPDVTTVPRLFPEISVSQQQGYGLLTSISETFDMKPFRNER